MAYSRVGGHDPASTGTILDATGLTVPSIPASADFMVLFSGAIDAHKTFQLAPDTATVYGDAGAIEAVRIDAITSTLRSIYVIPKAMGWTSTFTKLFVNSTGPLVSLQYFSGGIQITSTVATDYRFYADTVGGVNDNFTLNGYDSDASGLIVGFAFRQNFSGSGKSGTVTWQPNFSSLVGPFWEAMSDTHGYATWGRSGSDGNGEGDLYVLYTTQTQFFDQAIAGLVNFNGVIDLFRRVYQTVSGVLSSVGSVATSFLVSRLLSGIISLSGQSNTKTLWKRFYSSSLIIQAAVTGSLFFDLVLSGLIQMESSIKKKTSKVFDALINFSGFFDRTFLISRLFSGSLTLAKNIKKKFFKVFENTLDLIVTSYRTFIISRVFVGVLSFTGSLKKKTSKIFESLISLSGFFERTFSISRFLSGALPLVVDLNKKVFMAFEGTLNLIIDTYQTFRISRAFVGVLSFTDSIKKKTSKTFEALIDLSGFFDRTLSISRFLSGNLLLVKNIRKKFFRVFESTMDLVVDTYRTFLISRAFVGVLSFTSSIRKKTLKTFEALIDLSGVFGRTLSISRFLSGDLPLTTSIQKKVSKAFESTLNLIVDTYQTFRISRVLDGVLSFNTFFVKGLLSRLVAEIRMRVGAVGQEASGQIEMFVTSSDNEVNVEVRR